MVVLHRSTTHALLKFSHVIFKASDNSSNFIRIVFLDFLKAFDLVDSNVLMSKFLHYDFPPHVSAWSLSFLSERQQCVKINDRISNIVTTHAGTPQGTVSGPNDFKLLINDLTFTLPYVKYVDDTTYISVSEDPLDDSLQSESNNLLDWCEINGMKPNPKKTKEMIIYFGKSRDISAVPKLKFGDEEIERVESIKLLGVFFSSKLSWNLHVAFLLSKVSKRFFIIHQLVKIGVNSSEIIMIYCSIIRSVLEYACQVWHSGLTSSESKELERVQKRVLRIIFPFLSYKQALLTAKLDRLDVRRENLVRSTFQEITNPSHVLYNLLPPIKQKKLLYSFRLSI